MNNLMPHPHQPERNVLASLSLPGRIGKPSVDDIYPRIFDAILEQRIAPASRFTEESLGDVFGVSRSIIRRVLARLSHQQVVILRPNHRPQVAAPDLEQTRQILHARRLTEQTLVRLACKAPQPKDLQRLRELVERERQCLDRGERGPAIRLSGEFHLQLATMAGNGPLAQFLGSLVPLTSLALARHEIKSRRHCAWQEHLAIVDAIERGNVDEALQLMSEHLDHLEQKLLMAAGTGTSK
ncbi:GntR family transcriptional regulator [Pseudomonas hefeiensis]|uniref:GntR family transcriptional regulator n=1 Tax=Pseudomonas hefeiensis TaxID=2738125 RepID=A0ABY9G8S3_9PSED|nr:MULTISPECIES: GntR family transcriptional regulator [unclassified Pseudomonas]WLH12015.1 GntR family transcriptional regulator [Pseudomonas sp. FP205]WLH95070.1 GntR family transcriptional regulator [Pseudomonas sp. FP53]WLI39358.1 GntR family transcriptional regulator [Pseudomonas sp. FP821]